MASAIDDTKPVTGTPTTSSVRANFTAAKSEISALQSSEALKAPLASPTFTGTATIPTAAVTTLSLGGVAITSTAAEINILDGVTATATELNYVDVTTLGTAQASKAVTVSAGGVIDFNNLGMSNVDINSGAVDGTPIGSATPSSGAFTSLSSTSGTVADSTKWAAKSLSIVATLPGSPDANTIYLVTG